jgi:hypothetical protein
MIYWKKFKDFCIEYWKAFVAIVILLVGFVLGRKAHNEDVLESDLKAREGASKKITNGVIDATERFTEESRQLQKEKDIELEKIDNHTEKTKEKLSNNNKKLDKILQEDLGLKKGD